MKLIIFTLSFCLSFSALAKGKDCTDDSQFSDIPLTELQSLVSKNSATIIDVNSKSSYTKNKIPGAIHFGTNKDQLAKVLPKDKNAMIVAYCGGPMCTAWKRAAKASCELGYTNIRHFSGGISGWKPKAG